MTRANTSQKDTSEARPVTGQELRMGTRYRPQRISEPYDAIIIGSGLGGLTTGACLARMGKKVLVLEQHYTIGGFTHCFEKEGYEWGTGLHYVGGMGTRNPLSNVMSYITQGKLKWADMGENYDSYIIDGDRFDVLMGEGKFKAAMLQKFPNEGPALEKYLTLIREAAPAAQSFFGRKLFSRRMSQFLNPILNRRAPDYINTPAYDVIKSLTDNEKLIGVLLAQWGGCGTPPKRMSFVMHAGAVSHYMEGAFYPVGGSSQVARTILPVIENAGGNIFSYASVDKILVQKGRAAGVRMKDGTIIRCSTIVSAAGFYNTYEHLLTAEDAASMNTQPKAEVLEPSAAHIGLFIGMRKSANALNLPKTNYWIQPSLDHDANHSAFWKNSDANFPLIYVTFPASKDPDFEARYPNKSTIEIVVLTPYEHFEKWDGTAWGDRGADYEAFKEQLKGRVLTELYKVLPQIEGEIDVCEVSTPLTTKYFNNGKFGEIYGLAHTPERYDDPWLRIQTPIKGLYMTGQDAVSMGIAGATIGGFMTALKLLGWRDRLKLIKNIGAPANQPPPIQTRPTVETTAQSGE
ncbi:MAG: NAD(P)/FAD-dependent oxidoreductase [Parvibaculaceae bacterium]|nr:NAD(P)/FAD-dependent oxidoreductase [Parvibaculaceae bacterium]